MYPYTHTIGTQRPADTAVEEQFASSPQAITAGTPEDAAHLLSEISHIASFREYQPSSSNIPQKQILIVTEKPEQALAILRLIETLFVGSELLTVPYEPGDFGHHMNPPRVVFGDKTICEVLSGEPPDNCRIIVDVGGDLLQKIPDMFVEKGIPVDKYDRNHRICSYLRGDALVGMDPEHSFNGDGTTTFTFYVQQANPIVAPRHTLAFAIELAKQLGRYGFVLGKPEMYKKYHMTDDHPQDGETINVLMARRSAAVAEWEASLPPTESLEALTTRFINVATRRGPADDDEYLGVPISITVQDASKITALKELVEETAKALDAEITEQRSDLLTRPVGMLPRTNGALKQRAAS